MDDTRRRWLERAADMIPKLFEHARTSDRPAEYLLGERTIDGRVVRLTLRAEVVNGTGNCSGGLATMDGSHKARTDDAVPGSTRGD